MMPPTAFSTTSQNDACFSSREKPVNKPAINMAITRIRTPKAAAVRKLGDKAIYPTIHLMTSCSSEIAAMGGHLQHVPAMGWGDTEGSMSSALVLGQCPGAERIDPSLQNCRVSSSVVFRKQTAFMTTPSNIDEQTNHLAPARKVESVDDGFSGILDFGKIFLYADGGQLRRLARLGSDPNRSLNMPLTDRPDAPCRHHSNHTSKGALWALCHIWR
ncbi:hypothetical protein MES5069_310117 [Mesorhizobium escarrei]|uniref:Uncharacterized protein n=1 Tax=Mesorhizobium escarrei TaxID=666018 RepID=A0ABN8JZI7_9HYPH|nr:hypothetical protein MES5069_310117 [Mesorhizobium escarrei]